MNERPYTYAFSKNKFIPTFLLVVKIIFRTFKNIEFKNERTELTKTDKLLDRIKRRIQEWRKNVQGVENEEIWRWVRELRRHE